MSADFEVAMEGRIIALELLFREFLSYRIASENDAPLAAAESYKAEFLASLQHAELGMPSERGDLIWEEASRVIRLHLDQVIHRIASKQRRGILPPDAIA